MTANADDTDLDALAAQVRTHPRLDNAEMDAALASARSDNGGDANEKLVGHFLRQALDASLERRGRGLDVSDLYQEATVAVVAVIAGWIAGGQPSAGLDAAVTKAIATELDNALQQFEEHRKVEEQLVRDTSLLSAVRIRLKQKQQTDPTNEELAALLKWPLERVELVLETLQKAQVMHDLELLEYLEDE
jgi:DNA-directed RNA polymerase sigma subunit (sigma70/sigma32)